MSLNAAIAHGKEYRREYYRAGKHDRSCRPHGGCPYCADNRTHAMRQRYNASMDDLREWAKTLRQTEEGE